MLIIALFPAAGFSAQVLKVKPAKGVVIVEASAKEEKKFFREKFKEFIIHNKRTGEKTSATFLRKLNSTQVLRVKAVDQFWEGDLLTLELELKGSKRKHRFSPLSFDELSINSPFFMASGLLAIQKPRQLAFQLGFLKHNFDMSFTGEHYLKKLTGHKLGAYAAVKDRHLKLYMMMNYELEQLQGDANLYDSQADLMVSRNKGGLAFALPIKEIHFVGVSLEPHSVLLQGGVYEFRKHLFYWNEISISYLKNIRKFEAGVKYTPGHSLASEDGNEKVYEQEGDKLDLFTSWAKRKNLLVYGKFTYWLNTQKLGSSEDNSTKNAFGLFIGSRYLIRRNIRVEAAFSMNTNHFFNLDRYTDESKIAYRSIHMSVEKPFLKLGTYGASLALKTGDESQTSDGSDNKISSNQLAISLHTAFKL